MNLLIIGGPGFLAPVWSVAVWPKRVVRVTGNSDGNCPNRYWPDVIDRRRLGQQEDSCNDNGDFVTDYLKGH